MTTTIKLANYTPDHADSTAPVWPDEIHVLPSGRAKACHADSGDHSYQIDSDHLVEWLSSVGQEELAEIVAVNTRGEL